MGERTARSAIDVPGCALHGGPVLVAEGMVVIVRLRRSAPGHGSDSGEIVEHHLVGRMQPRSQECPAQPREQTDLGFLADDDRARAVERRADHTRPSSLVCAARAVRSGRPGSTGAPACSGERQVSGAGSSLIGAQGQTRLLPQRNTRLFSACRSADRRRPATGTPLRRVAWLPCATCATYPSWLA